MSYWEVNDYLSELTEISSADKDLCLKLSRSAFREIEVKLRGDVDRNDIRVTAAAGTLAYYKYLLRKSNISEDCITSFKAGDVNITQDSSAVSNQLKTAETMYRNAVTEIAPLCRDNCFAFENVRVNIKP